MIALVAAAWFASAGAAEPWVDIPVMEGAGGIGVSAAQGTVGTGLQVYAAGSIIGLFVRPATNGRLTIGDYVGFGAGIGGQTRPSSTLGPVWGEFRIDLGVQVQVRPVEDWSFGVRFAVTGQFDSVRDGAGAGDDPFWLEFLGRYDAFVVSVITPVPGIRVEPMWGATARWVFGTPWFAGVRYEWIRVRQEYGASQLQLMVGAQY